MSELEPLDDDKEPLHPSKLFAADALELDPDVRLGLGFGLWALSHTIISETHTRYVACGDDARCFC